MQSVKVVVVKGPDTGAKRESGDERISIGTAPDNQLVLKDPTVSRYHVEIVRRGDRLEVQDLGSTNGVVTSGVYIEKAAVAPGTVLNLGSTSIRVEDGGTFEQDAPPSEELEAVRGRSTAMRELFGRISRVAGSDASVLLNGETGVGKELVAREIHQASGRAGQPFETVDCGAISPALIASELFGHEKGAFTGADESREGAFERAHGGTLFLDEIGELPLALQPALLGAVERKVIRRVGGSKTIPVDVRVVSATHRDLRSAVNKSEFREDLYYRLAVVTLSIPPLRERIEDVPILVEHFLRLAGHTAPVDELVPPVVMDSLTRHKWPGNVRELRNFIEAFLVMGEAMPPSAVPHARGAAAGPGLVNQEGIDLLTGMPYREARTRLLDEFERAYLKKVLENSDDNVSEAARKSRIHRSYINVMLRRHGIR
ncbi:MAG: sigma 54-dependent Fis family transcriptional regulator [Deltaproteobacteria bacterium]|nr:sigma 54-dependent Fis family transcriptional regulator [Deltaproteobacteria bacterium]